MPRDTLGRTKLYPLELLAAKTKVGQADADAIALPVLLWFDAAKRGQCNAAGCNHLTTHLLIAGYLAAATNSKTFREVVIRAYAMLCKAAERPTKLLDLTTTEYAALKTAFALYLNALPNMEVGALNMACQYAQKVMTND